MGVFCTDRGSGNVWGCSSRVWDLLGQVLAAVDGLQVSDMCVRDGYVPSHVAGSWGKALFDRLGEVVMVCRPMPEWGPGLWPVAVFRKGSPVELHYTRAGEHLSVYDTPAIQAVLAFAQFCASTTGFAITTLRPPAPGTPRSNVAARYWLRRTGMLKRAGTLCR